jgi:hypothetical protein
MKIFTVAHTVEPGRSSAAHSCLRIVTANFRVFGEHELFSNGTPHKSKEQHGATMHFHNAIMR